MAITRVAELGDTVPTIISKARLISQFSAIMAGLCWNKPKPNHAGSTVNIPYFHEVAATVLVEGVDMIASETMADTNVQITLEENGAKIILTDNAIEDDAEEVRNVAGRILGQAMEKKRDEDLLGQLGAGATSLCGSGNVLTMGVLAAAKALLGGNATGTGGPAPLPYVIVLHPYQTLDIVDTLTPILPQLPAAGSTGMQAIGTAFTDDIIRNYTVGRLFGMNVVEDGNLAFTAVSIQGGAFAQGEGGGIVLATAREWDVRPERDESLRGWELNCVGRYGVGTYNTSWIVEIWSDATQPA